MNNLGKWIVAILLVLVAAFVLYRVITRQIGGTETSVTSTVTIDVTEIIPQGWSIQSGEWQSKCDFDADGTPEQLVVYRYDQPGGQLGALIFDSQINSGTPTSGSLSPYPPALLVPYKLLPDFYNDKGQGYLGEGAIMVYPIALETREQNDCVADEINVAGTITGTSNIKLPNFLSIFHWNGIEAGYAARHFVGNARIQINDNNDASKPILKLITYDRLNDRSALCAAQGYERPAMATDFTPTTFTIDFCFGAPPDPFYPEGVVVALLRNNKPSEKTSPNGQSYLTEKGQKALNELKLTVPAQVLSVSNAGAVTRTPGQAVACTPSNVTKQTEGDWLCGGEQATVITDVAMNGEPVRLIWTLTSIAKQNVVNDVHWRVDDVRTQ